ncbi:hypothetical protein, partial [uncultured Helicobacter sp.]|uniref:hypothetical protein n=1 Tax=uncultured Helicobacter sp. TaxID=175537 RepID=UPI0037502945
MFVLVAPQNPRQEGKPSVEIQENTESSVRLESSLTESRADSESKQLTESRVCAKEKGVSPLPALPSPEKDKA